jgi:hypothetical protein
MRRSRVTEKDPKGRTPARSRSARRLPRRALALAAASASILIAGIAIAAPRSSQPSTPYITGHPADPTNQTSAHLVYADSQAGVSFQCKLDGGAYVSCPQGGVSYAGPLGEGKHTFQVRASAGSKTSDDVSLSWAVDTTAPTTALAYPANGATLSAGAWGQGCPARAGLCGTAKDEHGIRSVAVSIRASNGRWWNGSAFNQTSESFLAADVSSGHNGPDWSYRLALPADGLYTVHVRATDQAGNTSSAANQASGSFTVDTTPPPIPTIDSGPAASTTEKGATFAFSDKEAVAFQCRHDGSKAASCHSPQSYGSNSLGSHVFEVSATDGAGNKSAAAVWAWSVVKTIEGKPFTVSGGAAGPLAPGLSRPLTLTIANPNNVAITVTALTVTVAAGSSKTGCDGPANLAVTQSNLSASNVVNVPAGGHISLPSGAVEAPQVLMKDLPTNQDACKNASFTFNYSGSAHS